MWTLEWFINKIRRYHGLRIQAKNNSGYRFWAQESLHPNSIFFLTSLYWQKQSDIKILIKNDTVHIVKSAFKERCRPFIV